MAKIMNTTEIESALVFFEKSYPGTCERIALPEKTFEGRAGHALRIGQRISKKTPAVLVLGGVHAREWGGPDIVVNLAGDLLRAGAAGKGLAFGKKQFSAEAIRSILDTTTVVIFPCVNPDGVTFSHATTPYWRKNRNPASAKKNDPDTVGVDINRNYDFLWDFRKHFHKAAARDTSLASDDPAEETFHGKKAFSEPETRNVRWLMDKLPNLVLFLDLHSYAGDVLYSWGDDQDQSTNPEETFTNRKFDGLRGDINKGYGEYLGPADQATAAGIAQDIADAMKAVRGQRYRPLQSVGLYPTCGTSDDYCFARHIVDPKLPKTFSYTLEFNCSRGDTTFLAPGDPKTLAAVTRDVVPGLITLCLAAPNVGVERGARARRRRSA